MRRRGRWGWVVAVVVVIAIAAGAFAAGEAIARSVIRDRVQQAVEEAGARVGSLDVDIPGLVIPQLIGGRIEHARVTGERVEYEGVTADVRLALQGVDVHGMTADDATATASLEAAALETLVSRASAGSAWEALGGAAAIALAEPDVEVSGDVPILGALHLTLRPSASEGRLLLSPTEVALGQWRLELPGALPPGVPTTLTQPIPVCLAEALPAGVTLSDARVEGERLIAHLVVDGGLLNDPTLQRPGGCA
ncbi:DUF2993 domain-containing protein [Microbacterium sp. Marseille-Q6965]|uniref:LmeA family phospholipid-binding protein n=1 Tax=Microbacterium sp. Marseille-Q6965 TaxID=2965072 RepID=UPI0021B83C76|nr:DUF2993 domain-containing protein [Microbacterium sp. Marseille-Q6965]